MVLKVGKDDQNMNNEKEYKIVDLGDQREEDIHIETFEDVETHDSPVMVNNYKTQTQKVSFLNKIKKAFSQENKILKKLESQANQIIALEDQMKKLSDDDLKAKTSEFQEAKIANGVSLDDIMIEAYAVAREAARRITGLHAFKVQLMGAIALHNGDIAEMKTGEGKTLTAIFPVYLNALSKQGVHVVTVNEYLAGVELKETEKYLNF